MIPRIRTRIALIINYMSRIGKKPIVLPAGVEAAISGNKVTIKGPKGTLDLPLHPHVRVQQVGSEMTVTVAEPEEKKDRSLWGLFRSLVNNMVVGVTAGYEKRLEMSGIGFKAAVKDNNLVLEIGYSHPVNFPIPSGIEINVDKEGIIIKGIDKALVGETAAYLRALKKPEPYKGKGIKYAGEIIRRKAGKAAVKSAA